MKVHDVREDRQHMVMFVTVPLDDTTDTLGRELLEALNDYHNKERNGNA